MHEPMIPVSVIVPNYNSGTYLPESIKSINSGQWPAEILIIDDCSTDGSLELAIELQQQYSNIRLLKREVNGGIAEAKKLGIATATQDLIAFVDADDLIETNALKEAYEKMITSNADICIWKLWRFDEEKQWQHDANPTGFPKKGAEAVLLTLGVWRIHPLGVSRKYLYERAFQGFAENGTNADELLTRLAFSHAKQVVGCNKKYYYRSNPLSSTRALSARSVTALRSHLWLLDFAHGYPGAPIKQMARGAIGDAWFYWTKRRQIGLTSTLRELQNFLPRIYRFKGLWALLWRSPKHLIALLILSVAAWVPV
ncbi:MAG: glycosyltransferase family 2 protein [Polaromonas sp.]